MFDDKLFDTIHHLLSPPHELHPPGTLEYHSRNAGGQTQHHAWDLLVPTKGTARLTIIHEGGKPWPDEVHSISINGVEVFPKPGMPAWDPVAGAVFIIKELYKR